MISYPYDINFSAFCLFSVLPTCLVGGLGHKPYNVQFLCKIWVWHLKWKVSMNLTYLDISWKLWMILQVFINPNSSDFAPILCSAAGGVGQRLYNDQFCCIYKFNDSKRCFSWAKPYWLYPGDLRWWSLFLSAQIRQILLSYGSPFWGTWSIAVYW